MTIVLDSGAIIASERNDPRFTAIIAAARKKRTPILVPTTVLAETWRASSTNALAAKLIGSVDEFPELTFVTAQRTGALLARSRTAAIVDGHVVEVAIRMRPATIVTSDPKDIMYVLQSENVSCAVVGSNALKADVVVIPI
ncbi:MAG: hypothetical protein NVS2B17_18070 [Candidatus Velthaea sp.]